MILFSNFILFGETSGDMRRAAKRSYVWVLAGFRFAPLRCEECNETFRLMAANPLPLWWSFKFQSQDATLHGGALTTDTYNGCKLDLFLDGTCYRVLLGRSVKVFNATENECGPWNKKQTMIYDYKYSAYGTQTYQSSKSCFPIAAHHQLEFEIVDVPFSSGRRQHDLSLSSSMNGDCRRAVRYVVDAKKLQCDSHMKMIAKVFSLPDQNEAMSDQS